MTRKSALKQTQGDQQMLHVGRSRRMRECQMELAKFGISSAIHRLPGYSPFCQPRSTWLCTVMLTPHCPTPRGARHIDCDGNGALSWITQRLCTVIKRPNRSRPATLVLYYRVEESHKIVYNVSTYYFMIVYLIIFPIPKKQQVL